MCRLFAFSFRGDTEETKRISYINSFRELAVSGAVLDASAPGHLDGWGTAIYTSGIPSPSVYKSVDKAVTDIAFKPEQFFMPGVMQAGLAHLRKKTVGEPSLANTHPFVEGVYSFAHNGTVAKQNELFPEVQEECIGATDSERLFRKFLKLKNESGLPVVEAYKKMLIETKLSCPEYSAINTVLYDGAFLCASRIINTDNPRYSKEEVENYYTLYLGRTHKGDTFISSEKFISDDITYVAIPNHSICIINQISGKEEIISL